MKKLKHLKTFESFEFESKKVSSSNSSNEYKDDFTLNELEEIFKFYEKIKNDININITESSNNKSRRINFILENLQKMDKIDLYEIYNKNESLKDFGRKIMIKLGLMDKDEDVEKRQEKMTSNLEKMIEKGYDKLFYDGEKVESKKDFIERIAKNGFVGKLIPSQKKSAINYKPGAYKFSRLGSGGSSHGLGV